MKNLSKILFIFVLLVASIFTFLLTRVDLNSASYPVEDGGIITSPNKIDTLHPSYLLIKSGDTFLFNDLSKELKTQQMSVIPSYLDRYYVHKEILAEESATTLDFKIIPDYLNEKYQVKYVINSAKFKTFSIGLENIAKGYFAKVQDSSVEIPLDKCNAIIKTKNKYIEIKNSIIWYEGQQGENIFDISFTCND